MYIALLVLALGAALSAWLVVASNRLKVLLLKLDEAALGIDLALIGRRRTLEKLAAAAAPFAGSDIGELLPQTSPMPAEIEKKAELCRELDRVTQGLNSVIQAHPELRASEECLVLQDAIWDSEDKVQAAVRVYNAQVSACNQAAVQFPASLLAKGGDYSSAQFFPEGER